MRWNALFADLEAQLDAADQASLVAEVRDRTRREQSLISVVDRLVPAVGQQVTVCVQGAGATTGTLSSAGVDWILLTGATRATDAELLIRSAAIMGIVGLGTASQSPTQTSPVGSRLDLRWALRGLVRNRAGVQVALIDGAILTGTLDHVGADYVELAEHAAGEPRRAAAVRRTRLVPLAALALLRANDG